MTEEQVKQIIVGMIESGELHIETKGKTINIFNNMHTSITTTITHHKGNGYKKVIYNHSVEL